MKGQGLSRAVTGGTGVNGLNHINLSRQQISELTRTSRHLVQNVLCDYDHTNSWIPTPTAVHPRTKITKIRSSSKIQTNFFRVVTKASVYEITQVETAEDEGAKSNVFRTKNSS